jgi:hypothetical protein
MKDLVSRVQRELPDTDQTRYDVAYERGRAQARSGLLFGGLALGSLAGAALMWLFDPSRGAGRRAQLASRATGLKNDVARAAEGRMEDLQNRAQGFAIERGIAAPPDESGGRTGGGDWGAGYREGFGQTENDPTAPGNDVPDPIRPADVAEYGSAGPVAGAGGIYSEAEIAEAEAEDAAMSRRQPDR